MHKQIYVNLPVADLDRSKAFFTRLGYAFEPRFTSEQAACLVIGAHIFVMLLVKDLFEDFATRPAGDPRAAREAILALSAGSRAEVDALVAKAVEAGGRAAGAVRDHGYMYEHGFEDPDGHQWALFHLDPDAPGAP
ncbi:VOC family protein [Burkholderia alba]|uniref:VOC family protein n=1 Tax=Burkholderia alba TaxID=2683677 RepID=UPI002B062472|nr:VOC family protein [Burkholderia alba]